MPVRVFCLILFSSLAASAQGDLLSLSPASGSSGIISLNLSLRSSGGQPPAAIQWTLAFSSDDFSAIQATAGPSATAAGKSVSCAGTSAAYTCVVVGLNANTIPDGVLAVISLTVSASTMDTRSFVQLENPVAATPSGASIPISAAGTAVTITPAVGIGVTNRSVQFAYIIGGAVPVAQTLQIIDRKGGARSWTATWTAPWLNITPASATTPSTITVSVVPTGLAASIYVDTIQISAAGTSGGTVRVTFIVEAPPVATLFMPITPCRVADTRDANGAFGGPALAGGSSRDFVIPNSSCGIPSNAAAYSLNVAVVPKRTLGYVTVWPAGQSQPVVATLSSLDGRIKSNAAIVPSGASGAISVFVTDATDLILDINGYFLPGPSSTALAFYPLPPCRVADTRNRVAPLGGPSLAANSTRTFPISQSTCNVPGRAQAYSLNFAALPNGSLGYLTAWPAGKSQPAMASLSALTDTVTANAAIVPAGNDGAVDVFATSEMDLVIDINGYFAPAGSGGLSLYGLTPCRVLDTRQADLPPFSGKRDVNVSTSGCGAPAAAQAYALNATVVPPLAFGYLSLWPQGLQQPVVSTLNAVDGAITSNMAIVPAANGSIELFASDPTDLILDIFGYFGP